jgi:hypothetical protein
VDGVESRGPGNDEGGRVTGRRWWPAWLAAGTLVLLVGCQEHGRLVDCDRVAEERWRALEDSLGAGRRIAMTREDLTDPMKVAAFERANGQAWRGGAPEVVRARDEYNRSVREFNAELARIPGAVTDQANGRPYKALVELR